MSRRRQRVTTGSTNLPRLPGASSSSSSSKSNNNNNNNNNYKHRGSRRTPTGPPLSQRPQPHHHHHGQQQPPQPQRRRRPDRSTEKNVERSRLRCVFPPRHKPPTPPKAPEYPPLKNVHVVPQPVNYDEKFGYNKFRQEKVATQQDLREKMRRSRLPAVLSTDVDGDGVIDSTEIRLAAIIREIEGDDRHLSEAEKVQLGRQIMAKELVMDLDDLEYKSMGQTFQSMSREEAADYIARDPDFREHFHQLIIRKATAKQQSSTRARNTLQQMAAERRAAEDQHAAGRAKHERNIWRASKSRAAELARNINTADRFRAATEGFHSFSSFGNHLARTKNSMLSRK